MAPKTIYSCRLFTSSLWLSAIYQIIDQSILSISGWEEREGWEKKAGVENSCGPSVKMAPKIAQSGWRQLCLQPPPVGFTHFAKILCWNVFHQLFLQLAVAGGGSKGPATPSEKELKRWIWGKTGSHTEIWDLSGPIGTPQGWGTTFFLNYGLSLATWHSASPQPKGFQWGGGMSDEKNGSISHPLCVCPLLCCCCCYGLLCTQTFFSIASSVGGFGYMRLSNLQ